MSSTVTAATARRITAAAKAATAGLRWETTSQGPHHFRVVLRSSVLDTLAEFISEDDAARTARNAMITLGFDATYGRDQRTGRMVLTVVDTDAREAAIAEQEERRVAAFAAEGVTVEPRSTAAVAAEAPLCRCGRPAASPEHAGRDSHAYDPAPAVVETTVETWGPDAVAVTREYDAPAAAQPALGRSERVAATVSAFRYQLVNEGPSSSTRGFAHRINHRDSGELIGTMRRVTRQGVTTYEVRDADGIRRVDGAGDRGTAALRFAEGIVHRQMAAEEELAWRQEESARWTPDAVLPSGVYGAKAVDRGYGRSLQVVQRIDGQWWGATPGCWGLDTLAGHQGASLAIDYGAGWVLNAGDTAALVGLAKAELARH